MRINHHIAQSRSNATQAIFIGNLRGNRVKLGIVVYLKLNPSGLNRLISFVNHSNGKVFGWGISWQQVYLGEAIRFGKFFLLAIILTKNKGSDHHCTFGWCCKPPHIEFGFGFAGSQEMPAAINPYLYPRMIIVGMCPSWSVNLTGGNTHRTVSCNSKG